MAVTISLIPFVKLPEVFSSLMTSPALLGKGLALGLVSTFFPFVSYTLGLRQMEAGKASVLAFSEPMVAAVAGIVVFGEMLRVENVLGILLIFTALVVLNSRKIKNLLFRQQQMKNRSRQLKRINLYRKQNLLLPEQKTNLLAKTITS